MGYISGYHAQILRNNSLINLHTIEAALTPRTVAVMLVHIGGLITPDADEIRALCGRRGVHLVEDAAHAHGSPKDMAMPSCPSGMCQTPGLCGRNN